MKQWQYLEVAYAPGKPTLSVSTGGWLPVDLIQVPDQYGWAAVTPALNELGAQGWELVGAVQELGVTKLFFKRPLAPDDAP
jgi:hypothetical protein